MTEARVLLWGLFSDVEKDLRCSGAGWSAYIFWESWKLQLRRN